MSEVLLLNADNTPLNIIKLKRAWGLFVDNKVDILETKADKLLRSAHTTQPYPSVLRLKYYVNVPRRKITWSRRAVFSRDNYTCQYCGKPVIPNKVGPDEATIDHIVSIESCKKQKINPSTWTNTVTACFKCNTRKKNRSLEDSGMKFINPEFTPKIPRTNYIVARGEIPKEWKIYIKI